MLLFTGFYLHFSIYNHSIVTFLVLHRCIYSLLFPLYVGNHAVAYFLVEKGMFSVLFIVSFFSLPEKRHEDKLINRILETILFPFFSKSWIVVEPSTARTGRIANGLKTTMEKRFH